MGRMWGPLGHRPFFSAAAREWVLDLDATYYAPAANNTVHDVTTNDLGVWAWVRTTSTDSIRILSKGQGIGISQTGYQFYLTTGNCFLLITDGTDRYFIRGNSGSVNDGAWHLVVGIIDRDNAANCKIYVDSVEDSTVRNGTLANVDSISNADIFTLGAESDTAAIFDGEIAEAGIAYPADIMAADELGAAGEIANIYNNFRTSASYPNLEDRWACNEGTGTTITGDNNDLTLTDAAAWKFATLSGT